MSPRQNQAQFIIDSCHLLFNNDELLPPTFRLLNLAFAELLEEVHDASHSPGVWLHPFRSGEHLRNRLTAL